MRLLWLLLPVIPSAFAGNNSDPLFWGTYRPNLYFGLRPKVPQSLMTGLMWFGTQDYQSITRTRHACDQGDGLEGYSWTEYDPREGGVQVINDAPNNVKITTQFLKVPGGEYGGSWAARVKGEPLTPARPSRISPIFYFGLEGLGGVEMETEEQENGIKGPVVFTGSTPELDDFTIRVVEGPSNTLITEGPHADAFRHRTGKTHLLGLRVPPGQVWQAKDFIQKPLIKYAQDSIGAYASDTARNYPDPAFVFQLPDEFDYNSNLFAIQKHYNGPFEFDIFFESGKQKLDSAVLDNGMPTLSAVYNQRFDSVFPIPSNYETSDLESLRSFSKAITSNLIGGIGYFYGTSIIDRGFAYEWDQEDDGGSEDLSGEKKGPTLVEPKALLTATPSRSFFPRGFYWDEGFHLLHIGQYDNDLSLEILKDWIDLIDDDGWVAREQILGEEARSRVPAEFQTQVPTNANPPTLTMAVTAFINRLREQKGLSEQDLGLDYGMGAQVPLTPDVSQPGRRLLDEPELALEYLRSIYKPLKRHYEWFRRTQRGQIKQYGRKARSRTEAYRWRGRSEQHVLTSGMDDYPRGPPHAGELHLDLISWMAFFSQTMRDIAEFIGETDDAIAFEEIAKATIGNIDDLHWSEENQMYCDVGVNDDDDSYHVCHKGYLSLFPFLLQLLPPDSPHLGAILDLLRDPEHLWSPYGLRSLSASHPDFGQGENYWKGPIWIQMNYLALSALYKTYGAQEGPYQQRAQAIYAELRRNVIENVHKEYVRTGYVWEQYDPLTGAGRRSHPFTGWTSLVTLIISEKYD
ncbi:glycoside hydrolase family 63 protein [Lentinus brumalis]|uniref:Mannosyl-oligosaccharide glucosidase n=1 Tax=Lentinus brumalis TaxID=2498619 RepID=A0A371D7C0_9APHY|nr:glycoside hydrolase family 63 protein [Polyporus brumalis]